MPEARPGQLSRSRIDAVLFDLDGVVTDTATLHAAAWKQAFDDLLRSKYGAGFEPFDRDSDYRRYVDGRPRLEGIRSFLAARHIDLPESEPSTADASALTITALGEHKQALFRQLLQEHGVRVRGNSVRLIRLLRRLGYRIAVVTASRNAGLVLHTAGLDSLFDARLDGELAAQLGLAGKPRPDTFLHAAQLLGALPARTAVVEDALAGLEAASAGGFGLVVALQQRGQEAAALAAGADLVVPDLLEWRVAEVAVSASAASLPSAMTLLTELPPRFKSEPPLLLLDYDGTLAAIAPRPEQALLEAGMRASVAGLAARCPVAIVSGRDLPVLKQLVGLPALAYAGDHGLDLVAADGQRHTLPELAEILPWVDQMEAWLRRELQGIDGILLERKRYSVAVHYRLVAAADLQRVREILAAAEARAAPLRAQPGKKVLEFLPAIGWHKGRAVEWLLQQLDPTAGRYPIYVGDDLTDEDAFRPLQGIGLGVLVREEDRPTAAQGALDGQGQVQAFLDALLEAIA
jgi:alpha,alpha-trehalase